MPLEPGDYESLAARWIDNELADAAMLRRVNDVEGAIIVGRNGAGRYAGILIPYFWPGDAGEREYRIRRDHPEMEGGRARQRYMAPPGRGNLLYLVPGTEPAWLDDPSLPIVVTEGESKTLALWRLAHHQLGDAAERPRFLPIGLSGVWNWRGTVGKTTDANGARVDEKGPIPDLSRIAWKARLVTVIFDADIENNDSVCAARHLLTKELSGRGAKVKWFAWPKDAKVKGIDDYLAASGSETVLRLIENARSARPGSAEQRSAPREFVALGDDRYRLAIPDLGTVFEIDRVRRERCELVGELCVRCDLPGARTYDGTLSIADFNLSSARARLDRARILADRANTRDLDWSGLLEEFCQRVLARNREGEPAIDLRELQKPAENDDINLGIVSLPRRHPSIIFGDGESLKSYFALYLAGCLAKQGLSVGLFDWELDGVDHRVRLERLFSDDMPKIMYARCERPLAHEAERLERIVRDDRLAFCIFDSVAYACDEPPEAAEVCNRYFRAVRQIGVGSRHIAHMTKGDGGDQKPFGSVFWHNSARAIWFMKRDEDSVDSETVHVALFQLQRVKRAKTEVESIAFDQSVCHRKL